MIENGTQVTGTTIGGAFTGIVVGYKEENNLYIVLLDSSTENKPVYVGVPIVTPVAEA
jgi:hypothetical protein